jgi:hypothetical protein
MRHQDGIVDPQQWLSVRRLRQLPPVRECQRKHGLSRLPVYSHGDNEEVSTL